MNRFVSPAVIALALSAAAPALAEGPRAQRALASQSVMICATDVATRRAYQREHGVAPVFVTARETVAARQARQTWSTPRCMTEREYNRLIATTNTRAGL
jgi:hypothetical protein